MIPKEYEKYEKTVTVSVVNFATVWGNKAANLAKIKSMITSASQIGSNIIAFPEMSLTGYECGEEARRDGKACSLHEEAAETIPGPSTEEVVELAKELGVYVLFGMPERDAKDPEVHYNSVAVIGPEGVLGSYRKIHLSSLPIWTDEICYRPGNTIPVFETRYGPIGVQICQDFWVYPELSRILWLKGARLIFNCAGSAIGPGKTQLITQTTACRGAESFIYAASANLVGTERTISYYGHSTIAGPAFPSTIKVFAQGGEREEIVTATLSFERLHHLWNLINLKKMRCSELILNEFNKLGGQWTDSQ